MSHADDIKRFFSKVASEPDENGCLMWLGTKTPRGSYGTIKIGDRTETAHRAAWIIHNGPIPDGLWCLHKCDVGLCVAVDHLWLGTPAENMADMDAKGRRVTVSRKGELNGTTKLTEQQASEVKWLALEGYNIEEIAALYNVSDSLVSAIKNGLAWSHIKPIEAPLPPIGSFKRRPWVSLPPLPTPTSKHRGVRWHGGKWKAEVQIGYRKLYLGTFAFEGDAAIAYNMHVAWYGLDRPLNTITPKTCGCTTNKKERKQWPDTF